jgi:hypothetical protein
VEGWGEWGGGNAGERISTGKGRIGYRCEGKRKIL